MVEKYALITGANSGVGFGLVERFMLSCKHGQLSPTVSKFRIILACRNRERAEAARASLAELYPEALVENGGRILLDVLLVDLSSSSSVREAAKIYREKYPKLDLLYANAGILKVDGVDYIAGCLNLALNPFTFFQDVSGTLKQSVGDKTNENIGLVFAANVYGHYLLIDQLFPVLSESARVIWTGSLTSNAQFFSWDDYQAIKSPHPYESSKYAAELVSCGLNLRFMASSDSRLKGCRSIIADPGVVSTSIMDSAMHWVMRVFLMVPVMFLASFFFDYITYTSKNAATSLLYLSGLVNNDIPVKSPAVDHGDFSKNLKYSSCTCSLRGSNENYVKVIEGGAIEKSDAQDMLFSMDKLKQKH